jgi:phospholipase D1/2
MRGAIAEAGRNCWTVVPASRVAFLVDAADYYRVLARALSAAEHAVYIIGWDVHSRVRLLRDRPSDGLPTELGPLLNALVERRPSLHVYVLNWDFAMIYAFEREVLPVFRFGWTTHERVHFRLDAQHPIGGSQHQKIVVIDDCLAFVGGMDLSAQRWDTPAHAPEDAGRVDPWGRPYPPHHDVQLAFDGEAAAVLGQLARERWRRATAQTLGPVHRGADVWPIELAPDVHDVNIALARTDPAYQGRSEVREVESLYLDMVRAARRTLYIENQYLTSTRVGEAIAARLAEPEGPEVVIMVPYECSGWLEESAMGLLRARLLRKLTAADYGRKLRVYYPVAQDGVPITVHSKIMIVDDDAVRIGSSNLNNRSMGVDTECDALVESCGREDVAAAIRGLRNRLLGEHLGVSGDTVASTVHEQKTLIAAIEKLRKDSTRLHVLEPQLDSWLDSVAPDSELLDPEKPIAMSEMVDRFIPQELNAAAAAPLIRTALILGMLVLVFVVWPSTDLGRDLSHQFSSIGDSLRALPSGPFLGTAWLAAAAVLAVPITVLATLAGFLYGVIMGGAVALAGAVVSAVIGYAIGTRLSRETVRRFGGRGLNRLSRRLAGGGLTSLLAVRILPVTPFCVLNVVAGATRVPFRQFVGSTFLAMAPGTVVLAMLGAQAATFVEQPSVGRAVAVLGSGFALVALIFGFRAFLSRNVRPKTRESVR